MDKHYNIMKSIIKCFTSLGALFVLVFGIGLFGGTIYVAFHDQIFLGNTSIKWTMLGISLGLSIAIIGGGAEGIYGICKQKSRYVCMFQIFVIIFMVIFIGLGILVQFAPDIIFDGDCKTSTNSVIVYANDLYNKSAIKFCQPGQCACSLDTASSDFNNTYNDAEKQILRNWNTDPSGFKNTEDCIKNETDEVEAALFTVIGNIENLLDCSLWCTDAYNVPNLIFRFSDVNNGKPTDYCYDKIYQLYLDYNNVAKIALLSAGGVMLLMFLCNMYLCCCNSERKGLSRRQRFLLMQEERDQYDRMDRYERRDREDYYDRRRR